MWRTFAAWAHLILYGEEATRKAQKEGEEAAAAYEQEKKDIAEGKIVPAPPKPEKKEKKQKKPKPAKEKKGDDKEKKDKSTGGKNTDATSRKRKHSFDDDGPGVKKKGKPGPKPSLKTDKESIAPVLAKGVYRVSAFSLRRFLLKTIVRLESISHQIHVSSHQIHVSPNSTPPGTGLVPGTS